MDTGSRGNCYIVICVERKKVLCIVDKKYGRKIRNIENCVKLYPDATYVVAICDESVNNQVSDMLMNVYNIKHIYKCKNYQFLYDL